MRALEELRLSRNIHLIREDSCQGHSDLMEPFLKMSLQIFKASLISPVYISICFYHKQVHKVNYFIAMQREIFIKPGIEKEGPQEQQQDIYAQFYFNLLYNYEDCPAP